MPDLKIKSVDPAVIRRLDEIVEQKQLADRSELVRGVLEKYLAFGDAFYAKELPDTVRILIRESLAEYLEKLSGLLQFALGRIEENTALLLKIGRMLDGD
jgi:hypothetical protein